MKRFVYVPHQKQDEASLNEAKILSNESRLQIMHGQQDDGIDSESVCIIAIPVKQKFTFDQCVKSGFIHSVEIIDEFNKFDKEAKMLVTTPSGKILEYKPRLSEKHLLMYRNRFNEIGNYRFSCLGADEKTHYDGEFEVI
jgi:hypothetical protein